jgi:hypothetical protein
MRFLIALVVNALIWLGLGKGGVEKFFPEIMASPYASTVPILMMFGGVLTALIIITNIIIFWAGKK